MNSITQINPINLIRPQRKIVGMSAILLPFKNDVASSIDDVDWTGFRNQLERTIDAGLIPAVNMDTGYANCIDESIRSRVLEETNRITNGREFLAGVYVADKPGAACNTTAYAQGIEQIQNANGTPILFQSFGLTQQSNEAIVDFYQWAATKCDSFYAFELSTQFAPFGRIYDLDVYEALVEIQACKGAKHSSLDRIQEWHRIELRDRVRPDFLVLTGNDLAIDMIMYGSDYLLGLSTFAPDWFALRDRLWEAGDPRFYVANDLLQYLGCLAFRHPVPAYKHSAAMFLKLRGWIDHDATHTLSPKRPESDRAILSEIIRSWNTQFA
jgi:dihydrodipicolinate synthase/N-acetylneuraminate lyase